MAVRNETTLDPRKVMTGHDGKLYITINGKSQFMANVDTFQAQINFSNTDFQPIGDLQVYAIPIAFIDSDDWIHKDFLRLLVGAAES